MTTVVITDWLAIERDTHSWALARPRKRGRRGAGWEQYAWFPTLGSAALAAVERLRDTDLAEVAAVTGLADAVRHSTERASHAVASAIRHAGLAEAA